MNGIFRNIKKKYIKIFLKNLIYLQIIIVGVGIIKRHMTRCNSSLIVPHKYMGWMPERQSSRFLCHLQVDMVGQITFQIKPHPMFANLKAHLEQIDVAVVFVGGTLKFSIIFKHLKRLRSSERLRPTIKGLAALNVTSHTFTHCLGSVR